VPIWDNSTQHKDALKHELLVARKGWMTVFRLQAYDPHSISLQGLWANRKNYLGKLAGLPVPALADLAHTRVKKMQYRPDFLDCFMADTGLTWTSL